MTISSALMALVPVALSFVIDEVGWRQAWLVAAGTIALVVVPVSWFGIIDRPSAVGQFPDGEPPTDHTDDVEEWGVERSEAVRTRAFWIWRSRRRSPRCSSPPSTSTRSRCWARAASRRPRRRSCSCRRCSAVGRIPRHGPCARPDGYSIRTGRHAGDALRLAAARRLGRIDRRRGPLRRLVGCSRAWSRSAPRCSPPGSAPATSDPSRAR